MTIPSYRRSRAVLVGSVLAVSLVSLLVATGCKGRKEGGATTKQAASEAVTKQEAATKDAPQKGPESPNGKKSPSAEELRKLAEKSIDPKQVKQVVNPSDLPPYAGPTGIIRGVVRATGDAPVGVKQALDKMEESCVDAPKTFGKLFREGEGRSLADVFVAVTGYDGFVPAKETTVVVEAKGCAWNTRTIGMTFGQNLSIKGLDNRPYVPKLHGQNMPAELFVMPGAAPVNIPPRRPGRFKLIDSMRLFNIAEVIVVPYATFDVTGTDGKFEISGIPVGKVKVNALLPQTLVVAEEEVEIQSGKVSELTFELAFDASTLEE